MKILLLAPSDCPLKDILTQAGHDVENTLEHVTAHCLAVWQPDFLISYGYRHILNKYILDYFGARSINLHISYLPYNRGADPHFWAAYDGTPSGVTIHHIDEGIDTGAILLQSRVEFDDDDTLATSKAKLHKEIIKLFINNMNHILTEEYYVRPQTDKGTYHNSKDKDEILSKLEKGWDTPLKEMQADCPKCNGTGVFNQTYCCDCMILAHPKRGDL